MLVPLDDLRHWYRCQQLFGELLRLELAYREPALVSVLPRRAAAGHNQVGNLDGAIGHVSAAQNSPKAMRQL